MSNKGNYKKIIVDAIHDLSGKQNPHNIFYDWVTCMALSIQNSCQLKHDEIWEARENEYKAIMLKYSLDERIELARMSSDLVLAFEDCVAKGKLADILGEIYMESGCSNNNTGQFFTPYSVSLLCADMTTADLKENETHSFAEPSCGGGAMVIALAESLMKRGFNYQKVLTGVCQDLDWLCVYMCYVQLSLLGIKAMVVQGDTLAEPYIEGYPRERIFITPARVLF